MHSKWWFLWTLCCGPMLAPHRVLCVICPGALINVTECDVYNALFVSPVVSVSPTRASKEWNSLMLGMSVLSRSFRANITMRVIDRVDSRSIRIQDCQKRRILSILKTQITSYVSSRVCRLPPSGGTLSYAVEGKVVLRPLKMQELAKVLRFMLRVTCNLRAGGDELWLVH